MMLLCYAMAAVTLSSVKSSSIDILKYTKQLNMCSVNVLFYTKRVPSEVTTEFMLSEAQLSLWPKVDFQHLFTGVYIFQKAPPPLGGGHFYLHF